VTRRYCVRRERDRRDAIVGLMIDVQDVQLRALLDGFGIKSVAADSLLASISVRDEPRRG
jgi:hypothetical protein